MDDVTLAAVTGAGGHLGRILCVALREAGFEVRALPHAVLDVRDAGAMLATQVDGTRNVIAARPRRLVHVSSIHAYDPALAEVVDEDRPLTTDARHFAYEPEQGARRGARAFVVSPTAMIGPDDLGPSAPLYKKASLATLGHYERVSVERASRELGWSPRPLRSTLEDTVAWWKSQS